MATAGRCKKNEMPTIEDWIIKLQELIEMAKLTSLVREKKDKDFLKRLEVLLRLFVERRMNRIHQLWIWTICKSSAKHWKSALTLQTETKADVERVLHCNPTSDSAPPQPQKKNTKQKPKPQNSEIFVNIKNVPYDNLKRLAKVNSSSVNLKRSE